MAPMVPGAVRAPGWDKPGTCPPLSPSRRGIAEGLANTQADWAPQDLFAVERSLRAAHRRLATLTEKANRK